MRLPAPTARLFLAPALLAALALLAFSGDAKAAQDPGSYYPAGPVAALSVSSGPVKYAQDRTLLATVSPNGDGLRDRARVSFTLRQAAYVRLTVSPTRRGPLKPVFTHQRYYGRGTHRVVWTPKRTLEPRTYVVQLRVTPYKGYTVRYGANSVKEATCGCARLAPVVRVQGLDASFTRQSYKPLSPATLLVRADAKRLTVQLFHAGPEKVNTLESNVMRGVPVTEPQVIPWARFRHKPHAFRVFVSDWRPGLYFAELRDESGRVGYAPFFVRPRALGATSRVAVVLPTYTWASYNLYDADGDGYGDSWYAGWSHRLVDLTRPHLTRGVPFRYKAYDLPPLHWFYRHTTGVEVISDDQLQAVPSGDALHKAYDLVVFSGHEEYVTAHQYDVVERYRDLGGNLMFLSANNFFWRVAFANRGDAIRKVALFRDSGRPESSLVGVQYAGNDAGEKLGPYVVSEEGFSRASWFFDQAGLEAGSSWGRYGIEIDARTKASPPGTLVLARVPDLYRPGLSAEMTYYETPRGAKVFAAGTLSFSSSVKTWPTTRLMTNLYGRLSQP